MIRPGTHRLPDGREARVLALEGGGLRALVSTLGASLLALWAPDAEGWAVNVALGHATLAGYLGDDAYLGAAVGRTAGRVGGAAVTVDGETHRLDANDGPNTLHGGPTGLHQKVWTVEDAGHAHVALAVESPDGAGGYPGALAVRLTYTLEAAGAGGAVRLDWEARATAPTPVALAHHGYYHLDGHDAGSVGGLVVQVEADRYAPIGPDLLPTGALAPVEGTPFDLRRPAPLASVLGAGTEQTERGGGLDHDFVTTAERQVPLRRIATVWGTSRALEVWTTEPGVHLYAGGSLDVADGTGGAAYGRHDGLALETQPPPDAMSHAAFPDVVLRPGDVLRSRTDLRFSALHPGDAPGAEAAPPAAPPGPRS